MIAKEELIDKIEAARKELNRSIDEDERSEVIYENSVRLDRLIELYIVGGY